MNEPTDHDTGLGRLDYVNWLIKQDYPFAMDSTSTVHKWLHSLGIEEIDLFFVYYLIRYHDNLVTRRPLEAHGRKMTNVHQVWEKLGEVPVDSECITENFKHFQAGTSIYDIWAWIEEKYDYPVHRLLYPLSCHLP